MAELTTLARPYAKAVFEVALAAQALTAWSEMLRLTATVVAKVVANDTVNNFLTSPTMTVEQQAQKLIEIVGDELNDQGQNFIRLLAENKRLSLLTEIVSLFEAMKANQEKSIDVEITSAFALGDETQEKLAKALRTRLQRDVKMACKIEQSLIGGIVIRAGDMVIDDSVRGKLNKLAEAMNS